MRILWCWFPYSKYRWNLIIMERRNKNKVLSANKEKSRDPKKDKHISDGANEENLSRRVKYKPKLKPLKGKRIEEDDEIKTEEIENKNNITIKNNAEENGEGQEKIHGIKNAQRKIQRNVNKRHTKNETIKKPDENRETSMFSSDENQIQSKTSPLKSHIEFNDIREKRNCGVSKENLKSMNERNSKPLKIKTSLTKQSQQAKSSNKNNKSLKLNESSFLQNDEDTLRETSLNQIKTIRENEVTGEKHTSILNRNDKHLDDLTEQLFEEHSEVKLKGIIKCNLAVKGHKQMSVKITDTELEQEALIIDIGRKLEVDVKVNALNEKTGKTLLHKEHEQQNISKDSSVTEDRINRPQEILKDTNENLIIHEGNNQTISSSSSIKVFRIRQKELLKADQETSFDVIKKAKKLVTPKLKLKYIENIIKKKCIPANRLVAKDGFYSYRENLRYVQDRISYKQSKVDRNFNKLVDQHWKRICESHNFSMNSSTDSIYSGLESGNIDIHGQIEFDQSKYGERIVNDKKSVRFTNKKINCRAKRITNNVKNGQSSRSNACDDSQLNNNTTENVCEHVDMAFQDVSCNVANDNLVNERMRKEENEGMNFSFTKDCMEQNFGKILNASNETSTLKSEVPVKRYNLRSRPNSELQELVNKKKSQIKEKPNGKNKVKHTAQLNQTTDDNRHSKPKKRK